MSLQGASGSEIYRGTQHIDQNQGLDPSVGSGEISQAHGSLAEHHFEQVDAHPPRASRNIFSAIWDGIKSLASSALKALTSLFPRANAGAPQNAAGMDAPRREHVRSQPLNEQQQDHIDTETNQPLSDTEKTRAKVGGETLSVSGNFWRDFSRSTFSIQDIGDPPTKLIPDRVTKDDATCLAALDTLKQFVGNDDALEKISQRMHQGLMGPIKTMEGQPFTPISYNGLPGMLSVDNMHPDHNSSYTLSKNDDGTFNLHVDSVDVMTMFIGRDGSAVHLDPDLSRWNYSQDMTFSKDGDLIPDSIRAHLTYNMVPADQ